MDPAAMDFVMHRAPPPPLVSSRGGLPPMSLDHQHSPCPALRAAAERNQLPGLHAQQRGGNGTNYDPVHSSIGGGNWWPHNNHDGWQHPPYSPPHMHSRQIPMYTHAPPFPGPSGLVPPMGTMQAGVQPVPPFGIGGMLGDYYNPHSHSHAHAHPPPRFAPRPNIMGLERVGRTASNQGGQNSNRGNIPEFDGNEQMPRANRLPALSHITPNPLSNALDREVASSTRSDQLGGQSSTPDRQAFTRTASNTVTMPPMPPRNPGTTRASRNRNRLPIPVSDSPSDEDSGPDEIEMITTSMLDAISADGVTDGGLRTAQLLRGAVSGRKIASRKAIAALESVEISKLPEGERTCIICYNDFGTETPEGINEAPLRLPKCQHVFGDHCIKKWFAESDSCPYCRDKLPSEEQSLHAPEHVFQMMRQHHLLTSRGTSRLPLANNEDADWLANDGLSTANARRVDTVLPSIRWDRRSPPGDTADSRRRFRPRHGSLRGNPQSARANYSNAPLMPGLPHGPYYNNNNNSTRYYPGSHNHRHSAGTLGSFIPPRSNEGQSGPEHNIPSYLVNAAMGQGNVPRFPFPNPLVNDETHFRNWGSRAEFYPPMSVNVNDPDVRMAYSDGNANLERNVNTSS